MSVFIMMGLVYFVSLIFKKYYVIKSRFTIAKSLVLLLFVLEFLFGLGLYTLFFEDGYVIFYNNHLKLLLSVIYFIIMTFTFSIVIFMNNKYIKR